MSKTNLLAFHYRIDNVFGFSGVLEKREFGYKYEWTTEPSFTYLTWRGIYLLVQRKTL